MERAFRVDGARRVERRFGVRVGAASDSVESSSPEDGTLARLPIRARVVPFVFLVASRGA